MKIIRKRSAAVFLAAALSSTMSLPVCAESSDLVWKTVGMGASLYQDLSLDLADGDYVPDDFSWSGGSGRVSISCDKVTITEGKAYAEIVFDSSAYAYVKVDGEIYYPSHEGDTSVFVIPVLLNTNDTIVGMTTKMSSAHEIEYQIFVSLAAETDRKDTTENDTEEDILDEEAPEILGLKFQSETKIEHAKYFKLYHYNQGITLLEIDMGNTDDRGADSTMVPDSDGSGMNPAQEAKTLLYQKRVVKYLIVPEKAEIPAGLDKQMIILKQPVKVAYVSSEPANAFLEDLNDRNGEILTAEDVGDYEELDWKKLIGEDCSLMLLPSDILQKEKTDSLEKVIEKSVLLDIPMVIDRSLDEADDAAKKEWSKVYEALF